MSWASAARHASAVPCHGVPVFLHTVVCLLFKTQLPCQGASARAMQGDLHMGLLSKAGAL